MNSRLDYGFVSRANVSSANKQAGAEAVTNIAIIMFILCVYAYTCMCVHMHMQRHTVTLLTNT